MIDDVDSGWDGQDGAEVLDEDNLSLNDDGDMRTLEELPDLLDVTHAAGDDDDDEALIAEDLDDDQIIALEAEAVDDDDDLVARFDDDDTEEVELARFDAVTPRAMSQANNDVDLEFSGDLDGLGVSDQGGAASMESDTVSDEDLERLGYSNAHTTGR